MDENELTVPLELEPPPKQSKLVGILVAVGALIGALALIVASAFVIPAEWGLWGTAVGELAILIVALLFALPLRRPLREIFPIRKPAKMPFFGSVFTYIGAFLFTFVASITLTALFPRMTEVSESISDLVMSDTFLVSLFVICVLPGICEEALCRGTILSALRPVKHVWVRVLVGGAMFGILHGDPLRMLPTAILGMSFCYIVVKSGNMLYTMFLHFINNLFSLSMSYLLQKLLEFSQDLADETRYITEPTGASSSEIDPETVAAMALPMTLGIVAIILGAGILFLYGGMRRLNGISIYDVDRKKRRIVQIVAIVLICGGFVSMLASCVAAVATVIPSA